MPNNKEQPPNATSRDELLLRLLKTPPQPRPKRERETKPKKKPRAK